MKIYKVKSFTNPKIEYTVRHLDNGEWRCDCPAFIFNDKKHCKHIEKEIKDQLPVCKRCGNATDIPKLPCNKCRIELFKIQADYKNR